MDLLALSFVQADGLNFKIFLCRVDLFCVLPSVILEPCDAEVLPLFQCFPQRLISAMRLTAFAVAVALPSSPNCCVARPSIPVS
jgi:hypothetical protein